MPRAYGDRPNVVPGTPDPDIVNAGWWGFLGLLFLSIAVFFLWKSMNKQLTRVTFDEVPVGPENLLGGEGQGFRLILKTKIELALK